MARKRYGTHARKYERQRLRTTKNKRKARERHLQDHPHDLQGKKQIERIIMMEE